MKAKQTQTKKRTVAARGTRVSTSRGVRKSAVRSVAKPAVKRVVVKKVAAKKPAAKQLTKRKKVAQHAKKVLIPHKANDFRPLLIRARGLATVLVLVIAAQLGYSYLTTGHASVLGRESNISAVELLKDTNKERVKQGLPVLEENEQLSQAAYLKAQDMFRSQYWAHVSPSGTQPWKWFSDAQYNYSYAGENLAKNYGDADDTVRAWMDSPAHRDNILKSQYKDVGFAVMNGELNGEDTTLVVALYGAPAAPEGKGFVGSLANDFSAPVVSSESALNPLTYFGSALGGLSPVAAATLILLAVVALVGVLAHHYRKQLPKALQQTWRKHHGMYTFIGMISLGVLVILAAGGGGSI